MSTEKPKARMESFQWLARLDGEESAADRQAFKRWQAEPGNAAAFARAERIWGLTGALSGRPDLERMKAQVHEEAAPGRKYFPGHWINMKLAASLAILIFGAAAFLVGQHYTPTEMFVTGPGQRSTVELEDGSRVILNVATRLEVKFGKDRRLVKLKAGEAVFTVAGDPMRPFAVTVGDGEVTALGTRFQVRHEDRRVTVTLLEGLVAVDREPARQHVQLHPGEQVWFTVENRALNREYVDPEVVTSWTTGRLKFRSTPLAQALQEINRYSRTKIRLADRSLEMTPVDGAFEVGNTASVVSALRSLLPVEVRKQDRREIVLGAR